MVYATSHGKIKPFKHKTLGLTIKNLTSSRKVVDILHRGGHCCNHHTIEKLETEPTYTITNKNTLCHQGVVTRPDLVTVVVSDNFDRYVETLNGKNTLHDTVSMLIHNACEDPIEKHDMNSSSDIENKHSTRPAKRRRTFIPPAPHEYEPLDKKSLNIKEYLLPPNDQARLDVVNNLEFIKKLDLLWIMSNFYDIENAPSWVGFNTKVLPDNRPQQKVFYLAMDPAAVYKTLRQSQIVAQECG